jgi:phosphoglycerate dehydrogenase-like enzyme
MYTVLVQGRIAAPYAPALKKILGAEWEVLVWDPARHDPSEFAAMAARADGVVGGGIPLPEWPETPQLKVFQIPWTGFDFTSPERMPSGVPVCNTFEHEISIAEYVMLAMLEWRIGLRNMDARFRTGGWNGKLPGGGELHGEVMGSTVGVVGYGHIGHEVAVRARAFGMQVCGVRRSVRPCPGELDWLGTPDRLDELLETSDFVVIACDMNEETIGMINAARLACMKPLGVLINVARGRIVDEDALFAALTERRIGGAILDVWYNYQQPDQPPVWPSNHPFQNLDNVILSAHESAMTQGQVDRRWRFVAQNLNRATTGEVLENVVFTGTGGPIR